MGNASGQRHPFSMWEALARWAENSQIRHFAIQIAVGLVVFYAAQWVFGGWVPDLIHQVVCRVIGPC